MTTKVVKGSVWTLAGQLLPLGFALVTAPFVIRFLGSEGYGVLVLIALIPSYFTFADLGMNLASTKFGSAAYAEGDPVKEARTIVTAAAITVITSIPVFILLMLFSQTIVEFFNVPEHRIAEASLALKFAAVTFIATLLSGVFNTPQVIRLRMDLNTGVTSIFRVAGIVATPLVVYLGGGIVGAVLVLMVASLFTLAGHIYISGRLLPQLFEFKAGRSAVRPLIKFGGALAFSGVASLLLVNAEKGMLSATVSVTVLAYYSVAFTLATMMTMFSSAMSQSLIPAFSQLQGEGDRARLNLLYSRGVRMALILVVPSLVFLSLIAKPFFTVWAGEEFGRESPIPFYILTIGLAFTAIAHFPGAAILAVGRSDIFAKLYWAELFPYLALTWFMVGYYGIVGAAAAWSLRLTVDGGIFFLIAGKVAGVTVRREELLPFLIPTAIMALPLFANLYFGELNAALVAGSLACAVVYCIFVWNRLLGPEETAWIRQRILGGVNRFR